MNQTQTLPSRSYQSSRYLSSHVFWALCLPKEDYGDLSQPINTTSLPDIYQVTDINNYWVESHSAQAEMLLVTVDKTDIVLSVFTENQHDTSTQLLHVDVFFPPLVHMQTWDSQYSVSAPMVRAQYYWLMAPAWGFQHSCFPSASPQAVHPGPSNSTETRSLSSSNLPLLFLLCLLLRALGALYPLLYHLCTSLYSQESAWLQIPELDACSVLVSINVSCILKYPKT